MLAANYVAARLREHYPVLYAGDDGLVAHECILDLRPLTAATGVTVDDVAKRLIDYGFHAPTMSFPVAGTLMVEPTETEDLGELDRFVDAMIAIRAEAERSREGEWPAEDNPLRNAPHTARVGHAEWKHPYSREQAVYPVRSLVRGKYWAPVRRIDRRTATATWSAPARPSRPSRSDPANARAARSDRGARPTRCGLLSRRSAPP